MPNQGVLPPIAVLPVAILAVLVVAAHLAALHADHTVALSRKRIRTANGVVMLVASVALAYAFAFAPVNNPARFTIAWGAAIMLLTVVLALSSLDALNNVRLARLQRRRVRTAADALQEQLAALLQTDPRPKSETKTLPTGPPTDAQATNSQPHPPAGPPDSH